MAISYPDTLLEPFYIDPERLPPPRNSNKKVQPLATKAQLAYAANIDEIVRIKWSFLFKIYGIETVEGQEADAWEALARALVNQHVGCFRVTNDANWRHQPKKRGRGRPKTNANDLEGRRSIAILKMQGVLLEKGKSASIKNVIRLLTSGNDPELLKRADVDATLFHTLDGRMMDKKSIETRFNENMKKVKKFTKSSPLASLNLATLGRPTTAT